MLPPADEPAEPERFAPEADGAAVAEEPQDRIRGGTPRGQAASRVIVALSRAARSFLLYDASNAAIRHFLEALRAATDGYFSEYGALDLVVRPFELASEGEVVYLDRDRERSMAFRLFRDGVRRLTLNQEITWSELLKFLEIISIRFTGVRQAEDDMVVLLWKAGFQHLQIEAVEGFVADGEGGSEVTFRRNGAPLVCAPDDFDLPLPRFGRPVEVDSEEVPEAVRQALCKEDTTQALPALCVRLAEELILAAEMPNGIPLDEGLPALRELRDFLVGEGTLDPLLGFIRCLRRARVAEDRERETLDALAASCVDARSIARLLRSVPRDALGASPEMEALLDSLPGDHLQSLMTVLLTERGEASRRAARSLIERYVPVRGQWIVDQLDSVDPLVGCELLRALAYADPDLALEGATRVSSRPEIDLQFQALHVLERATVTPATTQLLAKYVRSSHPEVRSRAIDTIGVRKVTDAVPAIIEFVKREAPLQLSLKDAEQAGEAMVRANPALALAAFREWCTPPRFFRFVLPGRAMLQWVSVAGLAFIPGEDAEALIRLVERTAEPALQRFCVGAMVRRRRRQRGAES